MGLRVEEVGGSEGPFVMKGIEVALVRATSPYAKAGANVSFDDFQPVSHHEKT